MNFLKAAHTDIGIKKSTNQDSVLIREADTDYGKVLLAVVCDGMGGLSSGEIASAAVINDISVWFETEFADILYDGMNKNELKISLENFIYRINDRIQKFGKRQGYNLGTTFTALIIFGNVYYVMNVGDSRIYKINRQFTQITKDHSYVQREIDQGNITPEEAERHPMRSVLLQCIGVNNNIYPDFFYGDVAEGDCFLLCTDGFRHTVSVEEMYQYLNPAVLPDEATMQNNLKYYTELNKHRAEKDNISAVLIKTY